MIQSEEVKDRRMPVMDLDLSRDRFVAMLVGLPVGVAALHASSRHPHRVAFVIVISSIGIGRMRRPPKLSAPDHERVLEHVPPLEIFEQTGDGLVRLSAVLPESRFDIRVLIPAPMSQFDKTNTRLRKATGEQALFPKSIGILLTDAIQSERLLRLPGEVHDIGNRLLHPKSELVAFDRALDQRGMLLPPQLLAIQRMDEIDLESLLGLGEGFVSEIIQPLIVLLSPSAQIDRTVALAAISDRKLGALESGREKGTSKVLRSPHRGRRIDRDKPGQTFILRSQSIQRPRPHRRANELETARVHLEKRRRVIWLIAMHPTEKTEIVGMTREMGKGI